MSMREEAGMMQRADFHLVSADEAELISRIAELDKRSVGADTAGRRAVPDFRYLPADPAVQPV